MADMGFARGGGAGEVAPPPGNAYCCLYRSGQGGTLGEFGDQMIRAAISWGFCACALWLLTALPARALDLTADEQAYVASHPHIPFCVDPDWEPFEIVNDKGEHQGIAADLLRLAAQRAGLSLELLRTKDWDESIAASKAGRCKILSFLNQTPKRDDWLLFTQPLFVDANVLITREEHPFVVDPGSLTDETLALPSGTSIEERVRHDYPNLRIIVTETEAQAIDMVSRRKADMTLRSLIIAAYTIKKQGLFNLKVAGQLPGYDNHLRIGVVKSEPMLRGILDKAVASITPTERGQIVNQHVSINVQTAVDYWLLAKIASGFTLALGLVLYWSLKLRRLNRELKRLYQTDPLTGLHNRSHLNARFEQEIERARRHGRPLSLLMIDLDHFKSVNDLFGHPTGDKVLVDFAAIARDTVRSLDCLGRWGGEEFLVICPETDIEQARQLAERLRNNVRNYSFATGRTETISVGVASFKEIDDAQSLTHRADTALYRSKKTGRDRVTLADSVKDQPGLV